MDQVTFAMMDRPYHLLPITERFSLEELENREQHFLAEQRIFGLDLSAPDPHLRLVVVVPVYNEEKSITVLLRCMEAQRLAADQFEVLVVNNNSSDHSAAEVLRFTYSSRIKVHLIEEPERGCLRAIRTGMDLAVQRLSQVSPCNSGWISTVDADDQVSTDWASRMLSACDEHRVDLLRGKTQMIIPLSPQVETIVKILCDAENRTNGYAELARQRFEEAQMEEHSHAYPRWFPRITGPNFIISRAAYIAVGGLDPRPPGDQASHLANPLLRQGSIAVQLDNPEIILFRSCRESFRNFDEAGGYGAGFGIGFGDMLSRARSFETSAKEIEYPNPAIVERGLNHVLEDFQSTDPARQAAGYEFMLQFLNSPPDPNILYNKAISGTLPPMIPLFAAKPVLIEMTKRLGGMDYRAAERFLHAREHLRLALLEIVEKAVDADLIMDKLIARMGFHQTEIPKHVISIIERLQTLPERDAPGWFNHACQEMESIYSGLKVNEVE
jgi:glycosyltransferase involved in cell wall biosynthesis